METPTKLHSATWIGKSHHREPLREQFNPQELDPAFQGNPEFDWETVFHNLDNLVPEQKKATADFSALAQMIGLIIDWVVQVDSRDPRALKIIGARTIAMAWVLNPARFSNESLSTISRAFGYSTHTLLSRHAADFSKKFGITNNFQKHGRKEKLK